MFDYVLDPLGVKVFIGGQDISNEYDYYGANLSKKTVLNYDWIYNETGSHADMNNYDLKYSGMEITHYREYGVGDRLLMSETEFHVLDEEDPLSDGFLNGSEAEKILDLNEFTHVWGEILYNREYDGFEHVLHSETYEYKVEEDGSRILVSGKEVFKKYDEDLEKEVKTISFRIYPDEGADGLTLDQGVWD
ncbi:hypothetical protein BVX93_00845, partial [bacterium B13(2017)]